MASIRPQVLAQLKRGPKSPEQLLKAIDEIENEKQLANCLYNLRKAGEVRRLDDGRYELGKEAGFAATRAKAAAKSRDPVPAAPAAKNLADHEQAELTHATVRAAGLLIARGAADPRKLPPEIREQRAALEEAAVKTQDALDDYLASVADPKILKPLRDARDATRASLKVFDALKVTGT